RPLLVSASADRTVRLWHVGSSHCLRVFPHPDIVTAVAFHPRQANVFLTGGLDERVRVWAAAQGAVLDWVDVGEMVTAAAFMPDGQGIAVGTAIGNCRFYSISGNHIMLHTREHTRPRRSCKLSILIARILHFRNPSHPSHCMHSFNSLTRFSPYMLCPAADGELSLDESVDLRGAKAKKLPPKKITGIQAVPGSSAHVLVSAADSRLQLYQGAQLKCKLQGHKNTASHLAAAVSVGGDFIVTPSEDGTIFLFNPPGLLAKTGQPNDRQKAYEYFACPSVSSAVAVWPLGVERRRVGQSSLTSGGAASASLPGLLPDQPRLIPRGTSSASPAATLTTRPGAAPSPATAAAPAAASSSGGSTVGLFYGGAAALTAAAVAPSPSPTLAGADWEQSSRGSHGDSNPSRPTTSASVGGSAGQHSTSTDLGGSGEADKAVRERFEAAVAAIADGGAGAAPGDGSGQAVQDGGWSVAAADGGAAAAAGASKPPLHSAAPGASRSPLRLFSPSWAASDELGGGGSSAADGLEAAAAAVAGTEGPTQTVPGAAAQAAAQAAGGAAAAASRRKEQMAAAAAAAAPTPPKGRAAATGGGAGGGAGGGGGEGGGWQWGEGTAERASALGLVIVAGSFMGELRVYQNMAAPSKG
ncbi:unnamed protein product, partial [Closterium sp. Naga37s-1]